MHLRCTLLLVWYFTHCHRLLCAHCLVITALAAATFLRSMTGFGFPLFAPAMYNALGYGKGDTILAAVAIALGCPACVTPDCFFARA